jgi:RND superfamily putative drug exporter
MVFRSLLVPAKAAVMNLLSIGAAYGVLVAIFQWGWFADAVGVAKEGPIEFFVPMFLFAVLFGLSMDYEVFLISRIKEEYDAHGDNGEAVARGLSATSRLITAAAAIMISVFASFAIGDSRVMKEFGIGLSVAIFVDATIVRMILVPATMHLAGRANWWLPGWLDRVLPRITVEAPAPGAGREAVPHGAGVPDQVMASRIER